MAEPERKKILDPEGPLIRTSDWISRITFSIYPFVDSLFFYLPGIDHHSKCLHFNRTPIIVACVLRSVLDILYCPSMILHFLRLVELLTTQNPISSKLSNAYDVVPIIFVNVFAFYPQPQLHFLRVYSFYSTPISLMVFTFSQHLCRLLSQWALTASLIEIKDVYFDSTILSFAAWWPTAAKSIYYCTLASHVIGACWYLLSINTELRCWRQELNISPQFFDMQNVTCGNLNQMEVSRLNSSCSFIEPNQTFDYGIFMGSLTSNVLKSSVGLLTKLFYCFWWGLRNLSSFGQNLDTSTNLGEIALATSICICSLVFFTMLLRNIQNFDRFYRKNFEEKRIKKYHREVWMSVQNIPKSLRKRIRQHEDYKFQNAWFVDEETMIRDLPKDIRRDVKRHLCSALLTKVPQFETIDSYLLDALCDKLKSIFYIEKTCILLEGETIKEMIFIKRGNLQILAQNGPSRSNLKDGDFFGEELVTWALDPNSSSDFLPISTRTVQTTSNIEAYALMLEDLKYIAPQLRTRFHENESRTRAAFKIQTAWFRYKNWKMELSLLAAEASPQSAQGMAVGTLALGVTNYASRFAPSGVPSVWEEGGSSNSSAT